MIYTLFMDHTSGRNFCQGFDLPTELVYAARPSDKLQISCHGSCVLVGKEYVIDPHNVSGIIAKFYVKEV